jgi:hypothetical protein
MLEQKNIQPLDRRFILSAEQRLALIENKLKEAEVTVKNRPNWIKIFRRR